LGIKKYFLAYSSAARLKAVIQKPREGLCCLFYFYRT
jgi:hypothetical protein